MIPMYLGWLPPIKDFKAHKIKDITTSFNETVISFPTIPFI